MDTDSVPLKHALCSTDVHALFCYMIYLRSHKPVQVLPVLTQFMYDDFVLQS